MTPTGTFEPSPFAAFAAAPGTVSGGETTRTLPTVSILVPVRDEESTLGECIAAIRAQDYPADLVEILVVDGRSRDRTREIAARLAEEEPRLRLLDNPEGRVATALNRAIAAARGDFVVRIDAHATVAPDYVRRAIERLLASGADNVGGPMRPRGETPTGEAIACAMRHRLGVGPAAFRYARRVESVDTVYLGAFPRSLFARVGGYDAALLRNQDYELNYRIRRAGGTILVDPAIRSTYQVRPGLGALARQFASYGYWKAQTLRRHPASLRARQLAAPALVAAFAAGLAGVIGLGLTSLATPGDPGAMPLRALAAAGLLAAAAYALVGLGAAAAALRHGAGVALRLPSVFATMHVAWGVGFWCGVLRPPRAVRRRQPSRASQTLEAPASIQSPGPAPAAAPPRAARA